MIQRTGYVTGLILLLSLAAPAVSAAQPPGERGGGRGGGRASDMPRDGVTPRTGTASLTGVVYVAVTGGPARLARVTLAASDGGGMRSAVTDADGRFAFLALPAGRYTLGASKAGHVAVTFGQTSPGRPGTPIQLTEGERFTAVLHLPRGGVITGSVVDEYGDSTPGIQVRALRYVTQGGRRALRPAGTASTDDRGVYRIFGLPPGEYVVSAIPRPSAFGGVRFEAGAAPQRTLLVESFPGGPQAGVRAALVQADDPPDTHPSGYAPIYYPGVTVASQAAPIPLGTGEERRGVNFQLERVPMARIEGMVLSAASSRAQNVQVTLVEAAQEVSGIVGYPARTDADGRFRIANVPPGNYRLLARGTMAEGARGAPAPRGRGGRGPLALNMPRLWGIADLVVDGRDVRDLVVTLQEGLSVSGRIAFDGTAQRPPADLRSLRVTLVPAERGPETLAQPAVASVDAAGRFTLASVLPGAYRVTASGAGAGWTLGSATIDGQDTLDFPFELAPGGVTREALVTFTDRRTSLDGALTNLRGAPAPGYTLILFAADERYWVPQSRRIRATRPSTDGLFSFGDLPPGEYRLAAIEDVEQGAWQDPAFLHQLEGTSMRVTIREGERKVQNVQVQTR